MSAERIVDAAVRVADHGGLNAISMRNVGKELGVEAMSLYHHVANKDALLDGVSEWIFAHIELPREGSWWRDGMRARAESAREVLSAHPWALGLIETRKNPGPALLTHHNAVLGCLMRDGFSARLATRAFSVIDSYVYGFVLSEQNLPFDGRGGASEWVSDMMPLTGAFPFLQEVVIQLAKEGDYSFSSEFDYGLELILDELQRRHDARVSRD